MQLEKLDSVVCSSLTSQGLPVHFYLKFLNYGVDILRNINMDVMKNVITKKIPVNSYKAFRLPDDYLDFVEIGVKVGQYVKGLPQKDNLSRLKNYNEDGVPVPYNGYQPQPIPDSGPYYDSGFVRVVNNKGEVKGAIYNYGGGPYRMSFRIIKERNEVQMDCAFPFDYVELTYITDGLDRCGCDTLINPYAFDVLKNGMIWQYYLNTKRLMNAAAPWERQYILAMQRLRGRMNPITPHDVLMIIRKNTKAVVKT